MEKRLDKVHVRSEKIELSCSWRLADMFDFKNGGSNMKLLTNGRSCKQKKISEARDSRKSNTLSTAIGKIKNVKGIPGSEMHNVGTFERHLQNLLRHESRTDNLSEKCTRSDMEQKNHKKVGKSSKRSWKFMHHLEDEYLQRHQQSSSSAVISSDKRVIAEMLEEVCHQIYQENSLEDLQRNVMSSNRCQLDQASMQLLQTRAKAFIDQIYINRNYNSVNGSDSEPKQFLEAAEILKLNMDLFLNLLRDPYSVFVKNIQNLQFLPWDKEKSKLFVEHKASVGDFKDLQSTMRKPKRDAKNSSSLASSRIVVLRPESKVKQTALHVSCHCSSRQSHQSLKNKGQIKRVNSLSLQEIMRKFRLTVRENQKKQNRILFDRNVNVLIHEKHSLRDVKNLSREQRKPVVLTETAKKSNESVIGRSKQQKLDIFLEAKRHLSERLKNVNMADSVHGKEAHRTLKMILSSRDQDLSESYSLKGHDNHTSAQVRCRNPEMAVESSSQNEEVEIASLPRLPKTNEDVSLSSGLITLGHQKQVLQLDETQELKSTSSVSDDFRPCDFADGMEVNEVLLPENSKILDMPDGPMRTANVIEEQNNEITKSPEDIESTDRSNLVHAGNFLMLDSSSPLDISKLQIIENIEEKEYRSPVSVLEPFSFEETESPTSMITEPAESLLQPRCLDFQDFSCVLPSRDHQIQATTTCVDEEDPLSLYVRAIIQLSGLNFEEFSPEATLCPDVLHSYIDQEVKPIASEVDCDIKLLLECAHEFIVGAYLCYFGCYPWTSLLTSKITRLPLKETFIHEVVKEVNNCLLPKTEQPTLDQLTTKDLTKSVSWLDLRNDAEDVLTQLAEDVLHDSILDTMLDINI